MVATLPRLNTDITSINAFGIARSTVSGAEDFDSMVTLDQPIIFNFHGYPWLVHRLTDRRHNHNNMHVRGYKEKGNINTPMELAIQNQIDRYSLAIDVIERVPRLKVAGAHVKEMLKDEQLSCRNYAYEHGIDKPEIVHWTWPY
jgi:xylulose-5-phosphate/fructose-6-phosphate phosphoketolase